MTMFTFAWYISISPHGIDGKHACLAQVKLAFEIEYNICKNSNKEKDFQKL